MKNINFRLLIFIIFLVFNLQYSHSQDWHEQFLPNIGSSHINDITFTDALTGYACTGVGQQGYTNYVLKTTNGGDNWNIILSMNKEFSRVVFLNANTGFLTGGFNSGSLIKKTTNGGASWFDLTLPPSNFYISDISMLDENTIWITSSWNIYHSTDGGITWNFQYYAYLLNHVYMFSNTLGFGSSEMDLFKTTNGGVNWSGVGGGAYTCISFINNNTGWKADEDIKKTTDGGNTWVPQNSPGSLYFSVVSPDILWGAGIFREINYSTNGGANWNYLVPDTTGQYFYFIKFINNSTGWAYTSTKGIHTTNGGGAITGSHQISSETPHQYKLSQNFPNPFNPSTKISYDLPVSGLVTLSIYDVLGRKVAVIVNQKQNAGTYEVNWDAGSYPSGVYFYTLVAKEFTETKKLVLIK